MDLTQKYGKSRVTQSPAIGAIMEKYNLLGNSMSMNQFHANYISKMDPSITIRMWSFFVKKYNKAVKEKNVSLIDRAADTAAHDIQLEESSLHKILTIADASLDEVINDPQRLAEIPIGKRLKWLFDAMAARDSRFKVQILKKEIDRRQNVYETMVKGAMYGALAPGQIQDQRERASQLPSQTDPLELPLEGEVEGEEEEETRTAIFNPDDL